MLEAVQEMVRPIEKPQNNRLRDIGGQVDSLGKKFLHKKINKHLGDWQIDKKDIQDGSESSHRFLDFHKSGEKEQLHVVYEKTKGQKESGWELNEFAFTLSDGRTKIILMKDGQGNWQVGRLNSREKKSGNDGLSLKEQIKLKNFIFKFQRDRIVNSIVDTIDPDEIYRYVVPVALTVGAAGHMALSNLGRPINATTLSEAFFNRPSSRAPMPDKSPAKKTIKSGQSEKSQVKNTVTFSSLEKSNPALQRSFQEGRTSVMASGNNESLLIREVDVLDNLQIVSGFFDKSVALKNGSQEAAAIKKSLLGMKDGFGRAIYQQPPGTLRLPDSIDRAVNNLNGKKFPYNKTDVYEIIKAIINFDGGHLVTPTDVMNQGGIFPNKNINGSSLYQSFAGNEDLFNARGQLKGNWLLINSNPGDLLATDDGAEGLSSTIIGVKSINNGTDFSALVWDYDEKTGVSTIKNYTSGQLPDQTVSFGGGR